MQIEKINSKQDVYIYANKKFEYLDRKNHSLLNSSTIPALELAQCLLSNLEYMHHHLSKNKKIVQIWNLRVRTHQGKYRILGIKRKQNKIYL